MENVSGKVVSGGTLERGEGILLRVLIFTSRLWQVQAARPESTTGNLTGTWDPGTPSPVTEPRFGAFPSTFEQTAEISESSPTPVPSHTTRL